MRARKRRGNRPTLRFTPYAWSKLLYLRDVGHTEVGGFGVSGTSGPELLRVEDVRLVSQQCTAASVEFDDGAVADHFDRCVDEGRVPEQFARIWIHTHPGDCALPSSTDEDTFARCFGQADWAVMFILADGGETYTRLQFNIGPTVAVQLNVEVEFEPEFAAAEPAVWDREYEDCVSVRDPFAMMESSWPAAARSSVLQSRGLQARGLQSRGLQSQQTGGRGDDAEFISVVTAELEAELEAEIEAERTDCSTDDSADHAAVLEAGEWDRLGSVHLSEAEVDDWYERWLAEAVFDPEVTEVQDDCSNRKEDRWARMCAANG